MEEKKIVLSLNQYQRDNLLWLFEVLRQLGYCGTGDWFGEIPYMLSPDGNLDSDARPNMSVEEGVKDIKRILGK